jgi:predicted NAD/FAD-binding protein
MEKIAIIGSGIAGMGCAYFLHKHFDITVFEQHDYVGGHTNTYYVPEDGKLLPIDTGFIVCNYENYPLLMQLFRQIGAPLKKTNMSFSAQVLDRKLEYCGSSINKLFAQRKNIFSARYIRFLLQLNRFNKTCIEVLHNESLQAMSVEAYCRYKGYHADLLNWYLLPMSSALWSTPPETTAVFPVYNLVTFFKNHGFLGLHTQFQWYTVDGGSEEYKKRLTESFRHKIKTNTKVIAAKRNDNTVEITTQQGQSLTYDKVIFAAHADQTLQILKNDNAMELDLLRHFQYEKNSATLHTDETLMPSKKLAWSSWNYRIDGLSGTKQASCTYWMNALQGVSDKKNYFVTINGVELIRPETIIKQCIYEHPIFTLETMQAQKKLNELNNDGQLYFCGSYFRYGFHEDALMSAVHVCEKILHRKVL